MICSTHPQALKIATTNARRTQLIHVVKRDVSGSIHVEAVNDSDDPSVFRPCTVVWPDGSSLYVV